MRDRMWGMRLRVIRTERCGLSLEQAAKLVGWHGSKLSRTERGLRPVATEEFATLVTAWGVDARERDKMLTELGAGSSSGWWDLPIPGLAGMWSTLGSFEAEASEIVSVAIGAVPGLLQTRETARHVVAADGVPPGDFDAIWEGRMKRQKILGKIDVTAFIHEAALVTCWGNRETHRAQLAHLLRCQEIGIAGVRVIPRNQTEVLLLHSWHWMRFPHTPPVVHVELLGGRGTTYVQDAEQYTATIRRLDRIALPKGGSRTLVRRLMEGG